jgi:hypothetical protein
MGQMNLSAPGYHRVLGSDPAGGVRENPHKGDDVRWPEPACSSISPRDVFYFRVYAVDPVSPQDLEKIAVIVRPQPNTGCFA